MQDDEDECGFEQNNNCQLLFKKLQLKNIILPNRSYEQQNYELIDRLESEKRLITIIKQLKRYELLAWVKQPKYSDYPSSSLQDVLVGIGKGKKEKLDRQKHHQVISESRIKRYYIFYETDVLMEKEHEKSKNSCSKRNLIPILKTRK